MKSLFYPFILDLQKRVGEVARLETCLPGSCRLGLRGLFVPSSIFSPDSPAPACQDKPLIPAAPSFLPLDSMGPEHSWQQVLLISIEFPSTPCSSLASFMVSGHSRPSAPTEHEAGFPMKHTLVPGWGMS